MNDRQIIKIGFCVAYDWELLKISVPRVYDHADIICFTLDKNRISWSGKPFEFDTPAFYQWVEQMDVQKKVRILEDNFYIENLSALENDNRQRTMMAQLMGKGGWHVQIDADEYFLDFKSFKEYLLKINQAPTGEEKPVNICANIIPLIKKTEEGYLYINNPRNCYEEFPVATNLPVYLAARRNGHFNILSTSFVVHQTWARGEVDLWNKLNSWGHNNDFISKESYFELWKVLDKYNYVYIKDFHPIVGKNWQALGYIPRVKIEEAIEWLRTEGQLTVDQSYLLKRNNKVLQLLRQKIKL
jgi:hypothetical protein